VKPLTPPSRLAAVLVTAAMLGACTSVPEALRPAPGERLLWTALAEGHWLYHCRLSNDGQTLAWAPSQPDALLRDPSGQAFGRLSAGPDFVHRDGSVAEARLKVRESGSQTAMPRAFYIAAPGGKPGAMTAVTGIQQLRTTGGVAPGQGCGSGEEIMAERRVPFSAEYRFLGR